MYGDSDPRRNFPEDEEYPEDEVHEIMREFTDMLWLATGDGREKRRAGTKPKWTVDPDHERALFSHLYKWKRGDLHDSDSGAHPLVHLAWRALAIAYQETHQD